MSSSRTPIDLNRDGVFVELAGWQATSLRAAYFEPQVFLEKLGIYSMPASVAGHST